MMNNSSFLFLKLLLVSISVLSNVVDDVWIKSIAEELNENLREMEKELGANYIKKLYSNFKYTSTIINTNKTLHEIVNKLEEKIDEVFSVLFQARKVMEAMQKLDNSTIHSTIFPCKGDENSEEDLDSTETPKNSLKLDSILEELKSKVTLLKNGIKQQYFISSSDLQSYHSPFLECNKIDHMLLWNNYMTRNNYVARNIVLLLDHGGSLSKRHFSIVTSVAKQVIGSLNEQDNIAVLAISNEWISPQLTEQCLLPNQVPKFAINLPKFSSATPATKKILNRFVDGLYKKNGVTNHSLAFQKALQVIENSQIQNETVMILYVSRGFLSSLTEAKTVLETIQVASDNVTCPFVINTCAVIDDKRPTIYETNFLEDVALQNFDKYNITYNIENTVYGNMVTVNNSDSIGFALVLFYDIFNQNTSYNLEKRIAFPVWDKESKDLTVSFSIGTLLNHNHFGVLGIDVYFSTFAEDLIYFSNKQKNYYAFLIDLEGRVILHPKFTSLTTVKQQLNYVDLSHFEKVPSFNTLKQRLLDESEGTESIKQFGLLVKWHWKRIRNWYVVCLVTRKSPSKPSRPYQVFWPLNSSETYDIRLVYQRFDDVFENSKLCRHLNQVATLDAGSLYLSSACFLSPSSLNDIQEEKSLLSYLQDSNHILVNPGLKEEIKDEVAALAYILSYLKHQHLSSLKSKYIVRRYVSSYNGVLEMFPGSIVVNQGLDPTERPWFIKAVEHKSNLIMVPPYLDEGGAGYIVTIAYATSDVVVALDVTYGYIFKLLLERMPFCLSSNITCFLMDDRGYLIYHPNLIDPNGHGPVEKQHIVHKESLVANDILSHKYFIKKVLCNSYGGGTVQRYYKLNMSYSDVLVSSVQSEHCVSYHITKLRNSNVFIGVVNATCNVVVTFCPCSIVDRLCLNCNRMEQKECECPCECPLEEETSCDDEFDNSNNPTCNWFPEHIYPKTQFYEDTVTEVKSCFPANCNQEQTHYKCLGVTGCEWCQFDVDGSSLLENPFCATMSTCFNGVLGSNTPYQNLQDDLPVDESYNNVPISIVTLFVFGILLFICIFYMYHRSTASPHTTERLYLSSTQENQLRMSDLNLTDNYHALSGNHRDKLLQDDKPDPISPYCVSSNYKRTTIAADSDHGYSTMTQHDESEHMSLAPVELDSLEDDLGSDSISIQTSISSKQNGRDSTLQFTCVPKNKCIVVPVIVHRNMETT